MASSSDDISPIDVVSIDGTTEVTGAAVDWHAVVQLKRAAIRKNAPAEDVMRLAALEQRLAHVRQQPIHRPSADDGRAPR